MTKKVLMFGWEFPPHISGGLGTACYGLTKALANLDISITFVVPKAIKPKDNQKDRFVELIGPEEVLCCNESQKVNTSISDHLWKYLQINSSLKPYQNIENYDQNHSHHESSYGTYCKKSINYTGIYGKNIFEEVVRYSTLGTHLAKKESFDLIHAHDWMTFLASIEAKKISEKPLIVHLHATEFDRSGEHPNFDIYNIEKYGLDMADKIITVSERTKNIVINKYNIAPHKIEVVYNGIGQDDQKEQEYQKQSKLSPTKDKIVLFLGRITMQKGPEYFLEAANIVLKRMKDVRFVMAGSGDMAKKMVEKMATLKLIDRFHFTGFLNPQERDNLFSMSDLYIMPSVSEPFGITPLEAIKHNVPIIISKQSGIAELLDHAIKVDFWDVEKLSQAIIKVLSRSDLKKKIIQENKKSIKKIDWHQSAKKVLKVYGQFK